MLPTRPIRWMLLPAAIAAAGAWAGLNPVGAAPPPTAILPDLVADPPTDPTLETDADPTSPRLLLRFDGYVHNSGQGPLELRAERAAATEPMTVLQRFSLPGGTWEDDASAAQIVFERQDGHNHWHVLHAARYSLWDATRTAEVAPAMKAGFCMVDSQPRDLHAGDELVYGGTRPNDFCGEDAPEALTVFQGISPGWRDVYDAGLAFQWVDVSDVQPGRYWLQSGVDPDGVVVEQAESNAPAWAAEESVIPGYVAEPLVVDVAADRSAIVTLDAERFAGALGSPGPVGYAVVSQPAHGALAPGPDGAELVYTPEEGYVGTDTFTYSARDASSPFPRSPAVATVSVRVGAADAPTVQIGGAPSSLVAGTSVQLRATVSGDAPSVTWSVDGDAASSGTIGAGGVYTAPSRPPADGAVVIAARSPRGALDRRTVAIVPAEPPRPAPLPAGGSAPATLPAAPAPPAPPPPAAPPGHEAHDHDHGAPSTAPGPAVGRRARSLLGDVQTSRLGRRLILRVRPLAAGRVRLTAYAGSRRLGACQARTPARRRFTCRIRIPRAVKLTTPLRVVASLRTRGRLIAVARPPAAPVSAGHHH